MTALHILEDDDHITSKSSLQAEHTKILQPFLIGLNSLSLKVSQTVLGIKTLESPSKEHTLGK